VQLSVKYRPQTFAQVVGQPVSVRILMNSILMGRVPNAMLLSGIRGTGKTTLARLYARALNCDNFLSTGDLCGTCPSCVEGHDSHPSIVERDSASYNGVDDVRELDVLLKQMILHNYRVFIFDECHMFSKSAQAALLKMVEEPPANTVFLLVTTEPQRLEDTLRSRCLQVPLKTLTPQETAQSVCAVLQAEGKKYEEAFVERLSALGGGSLRDVQQILEGMLIAAGDGPLNVSLLRDSLGIISTQEYGEMVDVLDQRDLRLFLEEISRWYEEGRDLKFLFLDGIPILLHDLMAHLCGIPEGTVGLPTAVPYEWLSCNLRLGVDEVRYLVREWETTAEMMRQTSRPRVIWSMFATKVCGVERGV
jgi:DNA polymerase III subunit gamma/tau